MANITEQQLKGEHSILSFQNPKALLHESVDLVADASEVVRSVQACLEKLSP